MTGSSSKSNGKWPSWSVIPGPAFGRVRHCNCPCLYCHLIVVAMATSRSSLFESPCCGRTHCGCRVAISTTAIVVAHVPLTVVGVTLYRDLTLAECPGVGVVVAIGVGIVHASVSLTVRVVGVRIVHD
ncbi:hypothetical protein EDB84DRAFT_1552378 [Lactarius hengduanensis]|nr:hypothetical protein EDB84DRAFT_1552378 [Lactarius hengduanensis]